MRDMTKKTKFTFGAGVAAAATLVVALGAAGAIAASKALSPAKESQAVIDDAARQLGIEPSALSEAITEALKNRVNAAVEAGLLTKEEASELKSRIDSGETSLLFGGFGHRRPGFGHPGPFGNLDAAAAYLGLTTAELREQLADKTLAEIAKARGKSVDGLVNTLVTAAEKAIDEAVADGRLTKEHAAKLKADLGEHVESLVNGEFRDHGFGFRHGFGPGSASPRGPPAFEGPRAY